MYVAPTTICPTKILIGGKSKDAWKVEAGCEHVSYKFCIRWDSVAKACDETPIDYYVSFGYYYQGPTKKADYEQFYCGPTYCSTSNRLASLPDCPTAAHGDECIEPS